MMPSDFDTDIALVSRIDAVPSILDVVCQTTGMGFAAVARVTADRWIACGLRDDIGFGLRPGGELPVTTTICSEVREAHDLVVIEHVAESQTFCNHPTPALYGFQSYISVPIVLPDGRFFGTLCAIDPKPARINTPATVGMFKLFAQMIGSQIDAQERLASSEASLLGERHTSELREQFIAVLGHDLRNPLAAIDAGTRMLQRTPRGESEARIVSLMRDSIARMSGLIDDVLDFARGRLGGGLTIQRDATAPLAPALTQVIDELRAGWPDRVITVEMALAEPVRCDRTRIAQLLSNLIGNALVHGGPGAPVRVDARTEQGQFVLSVANAGVPIPPEARERLFLPFARGAVTPSQKGLGLGLYIASEVARAHGGTLDVVSTASETRFTLRMPLA